MVIMNTSSNAKVNIAYCLMISLLLGISLAGCANDDSFPEYVISKNGLKGYMSATGKIVIEPQYKRARPFNEGYGVVTVRRADEMTYLIDKSGKVVLEVPYFATAGHVSDGMLSYEDIKSGLVNDLGYIDIKTGKIAIPPQFSETSGNFHNGFAVVGRDDLYDEDGCSKRLLIDKTGKRVTEQSYYGVSSFNGGIACVSIEKGKWILINKTFKNITNKHFDDIRIVGDGLAACEKNGKDALYNSEGKQLSENVFDFMGDFKEGLSWVRDNEKGLYGYIDKTGHYVIPLQFSDAGDFSEGLAYVSKKDQRGFIDKTGKLVLILNNVSNVTDRGFVGGRCLVEKGDGKIMFIDKQGKFYPLPPNVKVYATFRGEG